MNAKSIHRICTAAFALIALAAGVAYFALRPGIPFSQLSRIAPGMAQAEVVEVAGEPSDISDDRNSWVYRRWGSPGWIEIWFDDDGRVADVNDESPIRWHR